MKINFKLINFLLITSFFISCTKNDSSILDDNEVMFAKAKSFLIEKKNKSTPHNATKYDLLIKNLLFENTKIVKIGGFSSVITDLISYKNERKNNFLHTFYKVSFLIKDGEIQNGLIYTIHTNLSEVEINVDIQNILQYNSQKFSGEIVINSFNNRFILSTLFKNGEIQESNEIRDKSTDINSQINSGTPRNTTNNDCIDYYLVTTTYYSDGHVEENWEFLYTACNPCYTSGQPREYLVTDCDEGDIGGGGGHRKLQ